MAALGPVRSSQQPVGGDAATWTLCGLVIAAALVVNQSAVHWRQNVVDSHLFAYYGWCVSEGARPYVDVWDNKPPGVWWANAAGFALCGEGMGGELLISTLATAVSLIAFVVVARAAYGSSMSVLAAITGCVLLTHLVYEGGANRTETFVVACELTAVAGYVCWLRNRKLRWLILGAMAAGVAPLFKQSGLAAGVACAAHLALTQRRAAGWRLWLAVCGAFAVTPLCAAAALRIQGGLGEAWHAVGSFNRAYFAIGDATWLRVDRALDIYWETIKPLGWLFAAAGVGVGWELWSRWRSSSRTAGSDVLGLFVVWLLLAAYLACVGPGRRGHHFMPVLPTLGLLALYPLQKVSGGRGLAAGLVARPTSAVVLMLFVYGLWYLAVLDAGELRRCWDVKPTWYALSYAKPQAYQLQAEEVRRLTQPADEIYVWGWSPGTYRYAYRLPTSRFATFEKLGQVGAHAQFIFDEALADIRANPPRAFVISDPDLCGLRAEPTRDFNDWLLHNYEDRGVVQGMHIMLLAQARTAR